MAPWVKAEYANELAVLSAWLAALLPWNVSYAGDVAGGWLLFVRFPFFQVRYTFGVPLARAVRLDHPLSAVRFQSGTSLELPYQVWAVGAALVAVAVGLSVVFYRYEDRLAAGPVDPVRLMGGVIGAGTLVLAVATYYLYGNGLPTVEVPVGLLLTGALAVVLFTVEREGDGGSDATAEFDLDADSEGP